MNLQQAHALTLTLARLQSTVMKARTALAIAANHKRLLPHAERYQNDRLEIVKRLASRQEDGELTVVDGMYQFEDREAFQVEVDQLGQATVIEPLIMVSLNDLDMDGLTPIDAESLLPMVEGVF